MSAPARQCFIRMLLTFLSTTDASNVSKEEVAKLLGILPPSIFSCC